jgi:Carboxypeptidase regulatory-like domain
MYSPSVETWIEGTVFRKEDAMKHPVLRGLLLLAALCAAQSFVAAQTSQLTGRITDSNSAVVTGAGVTVTNLDTGVSRKTASNDEGYYTVASLPPGNYRITVQMDGFKPISQDGVTLVVDQVARLDFTLQVGDVTQVVNVEGSAPILEKETSTLGTLVDNKRILELNRPGISGDNLG